MRHLVRETAADEAFFSVRAPSLISVLDVVAEDFGQSRACAVSLAGPPAAFSADDREST